MGKEHLYSTNIVWTGNKGSGTSSYMAYSRDHVLSIIEKNDLPCSSDSIFQGDKTKHNPEDLFLASLSACHMLWYLHLCADAGVVVVSYSDNTKGTLLLDSDAGRFTSVVLHPVVFVSDESMIPRAIALHDAANKKCFIANSCNFIVKHEPEVFVSTTK